LENILSFLPTIGKAGDVKITTQTMFIFNLPCIIADLDDTHIRVGAIIGSTKCRPGVVSRVTFTAPEGSVFGSIEQYRVEFRSSAIEEDYPLLMWLCHKDESKSENEETVVREVSTTLKNTQAFLDSVAREDDNFDAHVTFMSGHARQFIPSTDEETRAWLLVPDQQTRYMVPILVLAGSEHFARTIDPTATKPLSPQMGLQYVLTADDDTILPMGRPMPGQTDYMTVSYMYGASANLMTAVVNMIVPTL
jgi:hypothetical protein